MSLIKHSDMLNHMGYEKTWTFFSLLALSMWMAITNPAFSQGNETATENTAVSNDDDDDEGKWGLVGLLGLLGLQRRVHDRHMGTHGNR